MNAASVLVAAHRDLRGRILVHPFIRSSARPLGLPREAFDRWLVEDHDLVVGFRRFPARLASD